MSKNNIFKKEGWYWISQKIGGKEMTKIFYFNKKRDYETVDKTPIIFLGKDYENFTQLFKIKAS